MDVFISMVFCLLYMMCIFDKILNHYVLSPPPVVLLLAFVHFKTSSRFTLNMYEAIVRGSLFGKSCYIIKAKLKFIFEASVH